MIKYPHNERTISGIGLRNVNQQRIHKKRGFELEFIRKNLRHLETAGGILCIEKILEKNCNNNGILVIIAKKENIREDRNDRSHSAGNKKENARRLGSI